MKVLCEMSGGADSTLAAIYAKRKYPDAHFIGLFVDYEQEYVGQEYNRSYALTQKLFAGNYTWDQIKVSYLSSSYVGEEPSTDLAPEYIPLRNLIITSLAASRAALYGAEVIVTGSKSFCKVPGDLYSFNDSTLPFYAVMEAAINQALEKGRVRIESLLAMGRTKKMDKMQVYRELLDAGVGLDEVWSCYHPTDRRKECGNCKNCLEKIRARRMAEIGTL